MVVSKSIVLRMWMDYEDTVTQCRGWRREPLCIKESCFVELLRRFSKGIIEMPVIVDSSVQANLFRLVNDPENFLNCFNETSIGKKRSVA